MKIGNDFHLDESVRKERHLESMKALGEIGLAIKTIAQHLEDLKKSQTKILTLVPNSPQSYAAEGYRFNSFYVSDAQVSDTCKIQVNIDGLQYTLTLAAGENKLNLPDGASLTLTNTSGNPSSFILSRYNINKS